VIRPDSERDDFTRVSEALQGRQIDWNVHEADIPLPKPVNNLAIPFDLLRYFFPTPPVPVRWRRRMLAIGSGDPTRAICSSLIAQAFQSVRYPILPETRVSETRRAMDPDQRELLHIRHHSLFVPRDFDLSPYFQVIKPYLVEAFDPHLLKWDEPAPSA